MPQLAPLVLNDGTNDITFKPRNIDRNGVASYVAETATPGVYYSLTIGMSGNEAQGHVMTAKLGVPSIVAIPNTDTTAVAIDFFEIKGRINRLSAGSDRTKSRVLANALLACATITSVFDDKEFIY